MSRPVLAGVPLGCPDNLFHWSTKQELGQGSFGIVYKATCAASCSSIGFHGMQAGATYAVKAVLKNEEIMLYLRREVSVLRMLDSEYFVKLLYAFQDSSTVYLVEELFEGKELFDVVVERRGLPERIAVDVARQLLEGLAYLHSLDIVHRDLKLENVLVQEDPESGQLRAKIIDFGLAKFLREPMSLNNPRCPYASSVFDVSSSSDESVEELASSDSGLLPDTPVGTKWYVDVHALQPLRAYATRLATRKDLRKLDIFSVGVITYVMLTGYFPFPSEDPKTHACGILEGVKFPSTLADQTSAQAKEFLRALLRPERTLRPSAQECLQMPWLTVQA